MPNQALEIRRLSDSSFDSATQVWNESFKGYVVNMELSVEGFIARLCLEGLEPDYSFLAFADSRPVGFLLNGIRANAKQKIGWNGGTGVAPDFRGQGVGKLLMKATLDLYRQQHVNLATLEAVSANKPAISLYREFGYEIIDRLVFLRNEGALRSAPDGNERNLVRKVPPAAVAELEFYDHSAPWQGQWQSVVIKNGEALVVSDDEGRDVAYALYTRKFDAEEKLTAITLFQCGVLPDKENDIETVSHVLNQVYAPAAAECARSTHNLSTKNAVVLQQLASMGFAPFIEQVQMAKTLT